MSLHVKLIAEDAEVECSKCHNTSVHSMRIVVFAEGGSDKTEPVCAACLSLGVELSALIEPPAPPPRQPPSRQLVKRTRKEERDLAAGAGGRRQPGSGNLPWAKGDGVLKGVARWDSKMCLSKTVSWTFDDLVKIRSEAAFGEVPAIITAFTDRTTHQVKERWVTIPYEVWEEKIIHASHQHQ
jgi:hypothetical protein